MKYAWAALATVTGIALAGGGPADRSAGRAQPTTRPAGLAEKYPGDVGLGADPAVILHEDFEAAEIDRTRWPNVSNKAGALKLVSQPDAARGGRQALQITATLGTNTGGHLFRRFTKGYERMHARFRVRFDEKCDYIHHSRAHGGPVAPHTVAHRRGGTQARGRQKVLRRHRAVGPVGPVPRPRRVAFLQLLVEDAPQP